MFGAIGQSVGTQQYSDCGVGTVDLLSMSFSPDRYSLEIWEKALNKTNPNISDRSGVSPLRYVIYSKDRNPMDDERSQKLASIIKLLIKNGADCNEANGAGDTALGMLCSKKWDDFPRLRELAFEQIRNNGIEPDSIKVKGEPLLLSMSHRPDRYSLMAWEAVLYNGLNPNISDSTGMNPLTSVIQNRSTYNIYFKDLVPIIELLIKYGADCNQANSAGDTALQMLCKKKWDDSPKLRELALEQIRNNGIEPDSLMGNGEPLLSAMSEFPEQYSKLGLRSIFRYGVLPVLKENKPEEPAAKKPKLDCEFKDELEKHKAHFYARPLEYRCICAVDRDLRGQELTMLPREIQKNIKHLFYS